MENLDKSKELLLKIAEVGLQNQSVPLIKDVFPFRHYFDAKGSLMLDKLSENDGLWTRREILTRFLFLQAVLDQGTHIDGVRHFMKDVTNSLYEKEIRFLHKPLDFFKELGIAVDDLTSIHATVKKIYAPIWAKENQSNANKFNLMRIDKNDSKQVVNYAIHRWGVPLAVPYLLEKDLQKNNQTSTEPLVDFIENFASLKIMSGQIKYNHNYKIAA